MRAQTDENRELWRAYRNTVFEADLPGGRIDIRVGEHHSALDEALRHAGCDCSCFITAWNPASEQLDQVESDGRNAALADELKREGLLAYSGRGRDPEGAWAAEESFLVLGLMREAALAAGQRHGQNAVVWGKVDGPARLLDSRGDEG